jgi:branched-subunit amino acid transport protein
VTVWWVVLGLVVVCAALRAAGPAVLGDHELPPPLQRVVAALAPALLAGLVVTEIGGERWTALDPGTVAGVGAAGAARMLRLPTLVALVLGTAVAVAVRVLTAAT